MPLRSEHTVCSEFMMIFIWINRYDFCMQVSLSSRLRCLAK